MSMSMQQMSEQITALNNTTNMLWVKIETLENAKQTKKRGPKEAPSPKKEASVEQKKKTMEDDF